jgi:hypothetical protein
MSSATTKDNAVTENAVTENAVTETSATAADDAEAHLDTLVEPPDERESPDRASWIYAHLGRFALPFVLFAASRVVQLALIRWMEPEGDRIRDKLLAWDAGFFIRMASEGYPRVLTYDPDGHMIGNGLAFFPGYPMLARGLYLLGVDAVAAVIIVAWVAGGLATLAVYALGAELYNHRTGVVLAVLFCAQPMSAVLSMAYAEGLFVLFAAAALTFAHRRSWLLAGAFGLAGSLTRPTGAALAVAVAIAAALHLKERGPHRWRAVLAACVALAGVPAYLIWVGLRVGVWDGWFKEQTEGWGTTFDYGQGVFKFLREALRQGDGWMQVSVAWLIVATVVAAGLAVARRVWTPLVVYGLTVLILVLGQSGFYHSKPRLLVPTLLIFVPAAVALGKARTSTVVVALSAYAAFGLWYGSYMLTVWHYAI